MKSNRSRVARRLSHSVTVSFVEPWTLDEIDSAARRINNAIISGRRAGETMQVSNTPVTQRGSGTDSITIAKIKEAASYLAEGSPSVVLERDVDFFLDDADVKTSFNRMRTYVTNALKAKPFEMKAATKQVTDGDTIVGLRVSWYPLDTPQAAAEETAAEETTE